MRQFGLIAFTQPHLINYEALKITSLLDCGFDYVHIRKPDANIVDITNLIEQIPQEYHSRLKLHDKHQLAQKYNLGGVHLNRRNFVVPNFKTLLSCSTHSFLEMDKALKTGLFEYVTLSPIFNSISKTGYNAAFKEKDIINNISGKPIIALGGIKLDYVPKLVNMGFWGCAMLGEIWQNTNFVYFIQNIIKLRKNYATIYNKSII